jgi:hypothetical protein
VVGFSRRRALINALTCVPGAGCGTAAASVRAVDRDGEGSADLSHASVGQPSEALDEDRNGDTLDRVQVDRAASGYRILARLETDFADEAADRGRAWRDKCTPVSRDHRIAGEDDDRAAADPSHLTPPDLGARWQRVHDRPAASRNDAKSPHSSGSSRGCSSYAA